MQRRFTAQRRDQLARMVQERGHLSISEAAEVFSVSTETIRKDIIALDREGLVTKSHGGAMLPSDAKERPITKKKAENRAQKLAVARHVADSIPDGSSVIIDAGSSVAAVAELLAERSGLTLFINSVMALEHLIGSDNELFMLGGRIRPYSTATVGDWAIQELASISADYSILGADSVASAGGPTINAYSEVAVKHAMVDASTTRIVVADSSKFKRSGAFQIARWDQIDRLVTDQILDEAAFEQTNQLVRIETVR